MRITPAAELAYRCKKLQHYMVEEGLDAVIILQNADLFYFTGTIQTGNLYVPAEGEPLYLVHEPESAPAFSVDVLRVNPRIMSSHRASLDTLVGDLFEPALHDYGDVARRAGRPVVVPHHAAG